MSRGVPSEAQLAARIKPGQTLNPHGRPKKIWTPEELFERQVKKDLKAAAKEFSPEALMTLVEIMRDKTTPPQHRMAAATQLLDRGHGRATTHTEISVDIFNRYSETDLVKFITGQEIEGEVLSSETDEDSVED